METGNAEVKSEHSLGTRHTEEGKSFRLWLRAVPLQVYDDDSLKAQVAELRRETYMLSCELQKHATMCMELSDANRVLMDELKKMCEPEVIRILEAKNPDNPQTD